MPVLLHKLNNTTQYLGALQALLCDSALDPARAHALEGLAQTAHEVDDLGWILGLIANASGADVLLERRERTRFTALVRMVADCLRREGRNLARPDRALPALEARSAPDAWTLPWAAARWLYCAGCALPAGATLEWELEDRAGRAALLCRIAPSASLEHVWESLRAFDPRLEREMGAQACTLLLPPGAQLVPVRAT